MNRRGAMILWCSECRQYFSADRGRVCPRCGTEAVQMRCSRCGHVWTPRSRRLPKSCPDKRCKSPYWNRARMLVKEGKE